MDSLACAPRASSSTASNLRAILLTEFLTTPAFAPALSHFGARHDGTFSCACRLTPRAPRPPGASSCNASPDGSYLAPRHRCCAPQCSASRPARRNRRRNPEVPAATRTVNLTLEQRHVIRELVRDLKIDRASDDDSKLAAGDEVPGKVTLHPIPPLIGQKVPQIKVAPLLRDPEPDRHRRPPGPEGGRGDRVARRVFLASPTQFWLTPTIR